MDDGFNSERVSSNLIMPIHYLLYCNLDNKKEERITGCYLTPFLYGSSKLMEMFMESPGRVFTKDQIFEHGWDDSFVDDNTIRVTIRRLRDKIGGERIKTIRGLGYRLEIK